MKAVLVIFVIIIFITICKSTDELSDLDSKNLAIFCKITTKENIFDDEQINAIKEIRKLFVPKNYFLINDKIVKNDILPVLRRNLNSTDEIYVYEALITLTEIAGFKYKYSKAIIKQNFFPKLINFLHSNNTKIVLQTFKALKNIIEGYSNQSFYFSETKLIESLTTLIGSNKTTLKEWREISAVLKFLYPPRDEFYYIMDKVYPLELKVRPILEFLLQKNDSIILINTVSTLVHIRNSITQFDDIKIISLLDHNDSRIQSAALQLIQYNTNKINLFDNNIPKKLAQILKNSSNNEILNRVLLLLKNIFNIFQDRVNVIFDTEFLPLILYHLDHSASSYEIQEITAEMISKALTTENETNFLKLLKLNVIPILCNLLIRAKQNTDFSMIIIPFHDFLSDVDEKKLFCKYFTKKLQKCRETIIQMTSGMNSKYLLSYGFCDNDDVDGGQCYIADRWYACIKEDPEYCKFLFE